MGGVDQQDDHTFRISFTGDGVAKLRDRVKEKLKEFMGDYTDDSLVEYVIVLLRNGRCKGEARTELNVFLGDDSDCFVSWLWGHLASNLDMYAQQQELIPGDEAKSIIALGKHGEKSDPQNLHSESDGEKSPKVIRSRRKREWKGIIRDAEDPPPLRSSEIDKMHAEDNNHHKVISSKRTISPRNPLSRKRNHPDERHIDEKRPDGRLPDWSHSDKRLRDERRHVERRPNESHNVKAVDLEAAPSTTRRLLQFAVREAVGTTRPSIASNNTKFKPEAVGTKRPSIASNTTKFKRLRSVVSTSTNDDTLDALPQRIQSIERMSNGVAVAIKAVAEAAQDVVKHRSGANIFDRLSPSGDVSENTIEFGLPADEDENMPQIDLGDNYEKTQLPNYFQGDDNDGRYVTEPTMTDNGNGFVHHSAFDCEGYGYGGVNSLENQTDHPSISNTLLKSNNYEHDQRPALATTPRNIINSPADGSARRPLHYHEPSGISRVNNRQHLPKEKPVRPLTKENNIRDTLHNGNAKSATRLQNEAEKKVPSVSGPHSSIQPLKDAHSRTVFVNNVHFAATKESLAKHFNKFGEVLKVVIVTDAATGQPKGSACVEFKRKVEAELALSSDSTSFMSRILKVSKTSTDVPEAAVTWPRAAPVARFSQAPFPRGIHGAFRARRMIKPGARSLQWKRDSPMTPAETGVPCPTGRNLTYVRTA